MVPDRSRHWRAPGLAACSARLPSKTRTARSTRRRSSRTARARAVRIPGRPMSGGAAGFPCARLSGTLPSGCSRRLSLAGQPGRRIRHRSSLRHLRLNRALRLRRPFRYRGSLGPRWRLVRGNWPPRLNPSPSHGCPPAVPIAKELPGASTFERVPAFRTHRIGHIPPAGLADDYFRGRAADNPQFLTEKARAFHDITSNPGTFPHDRHDHSSGCAQRLS
jgi:hypothetical protein